MGPEQVTIAGLDGIERVGEAVDVEGVTAGLEAERSQIPHWFSIRPDDPASARAQRFQDALVLCRYEITVEALISSPEICRSRQLFAPEHPSIRDLVSRHGVVVALKIEPVGRCCYIEDGAR